MLKLWIACVNWRGNHCDSSPEVAESRWKTVHHSLRVVVVVYHNNAIYMKKWATSQFKLSQSAAEKTLNIKTNLKNFDEKKSQQLDKK